MTQYSLFGAAAAPPAVTDLDGVLLAGGHWARSAAGARLSVVVADEWRARALVAAFEQLGLAGEEAVVPAEAGGQAARTTFDTRLNGPAARWTRGANEGPPAELDLSAGALRLWVIAAGRPDEAGFLLGTDRPDDAIHMLGGAQLSRLGLAAVSIGVRGGPGWRVTSTKRLRRLAELVGEAPDGAAEHWPAMP